MKKLIIEFREMLPFFIIQYFSYDRNVAFFASKSSRRLVNDPTRDCRDLKYFMIANTKT